MRCAAMWGRRSHYGGTTQIEFARERIFAAENLAREVNWSWEGEVVNGCIIYSQCSTKYQVETFSEVSCVFCV